MAFTLPKVGFQPQGQTQAPLTGGQVQKKLDISSNPALQGFLGSQVKPFMFNQPTAPTQSMGVPAKSPTQNIQPQQNVLPPNQQATYKGVPTAPGISTNMQPTPTTTAWSS